MRHFFSITFAVLTLSLLGACGFWKKTPQNESGIALQYIDGDIVAGNSAGMVAGFYEHVFKGQEGRPRIAIYSHWDALPPENFKGVHVFVDGESSGPMGQHRKHLDRMLYVGPLSDTGAKESIYIPFASLHFAERKAANPLDLLHAAPVTAKPYFAAYLVSNCVSFREDLYDRLVELAQRENLGPVHALSKCFGKYPETKHSLTEEKKRNNLNYLDSAVEIFKDYQFVLTSENVIIDGYVTEKPISALLAGAVPIYIGSRAILDRGFLNPKSFLFIDDANSFGSFEKQILELAKGNEKKSEMLKASPVLDLEQLYLYSWHRVVAEEFRNIGKDSLVDLIRVAVKNVIKEANHQ